MSFGSLAALGHQILILRAHLFRRLRCVICRHVAHVVGGQVRHHAGHDRIVARPRLEFGQLLEQIFLMLAREAWIRRQKTVAVESMAGCANFADDRLSFGRIACCMSGGNGDECDQRRDETIHERSLIYRGIGRHTGPDRIDILT